MLEMEGNMTESEYSIFNLGVGDIETVNVLELEGSLEARLLEGVNRNKSGYVRTLISIDGESSVIIPSGISDEDALMLSDLLTKEVSTFYTDNKEPFNPLSYTDSLETLLMASKVATEDEEIKTIQLSRYGYINIPPHLTDEQIIFLNRMLFNGVEILRKNS